MATGIFDAIYSIAGIITNIVRKMVSTIPLELNISLLILAFIIGFFINKKIETTKGTWILISLMVFLLLRFV